MSSLRERIEGLVAEFRKLADEVDDKSGVTMWHVEHELWAAFAPKHQMLCISCFDELTKEQDIVLYWTARVSRHSEPVWAALHKEEAGGDGLREAAQAAVTKSDKSMRCWGCSTMQVEPVGGPAYGPFPHDKDCFIERLRVALATSPAGRAEPK